MAVTVHSKFTVPVIDDDFVILIDCDDGRSVTNDAENVIRWLDEHLETGLSQRKVYYRDTIGKYAELVHENATFDSFSPCPSHVELALDELVKQSGDNTDVLSS